MLEARITSRNAAQAAVGVSNLARHDMKSPTGVPWGGEPLTCHIGEVKRQRANGFGYSRYQISMIGDKITSANYAHGVDLEHVHCA